MKAIEIIEAMTYDSSLAECTDVLTYDSDHETVKDWIARLFGSFHLEDGELYDGVYLVAWQVDANRFYPFDANYPPEVVLERDNPEDGAEDDQEVWLWRIE